MSFDDPRFKGLTAEGKAGLVAQITRLNLGVVKNVLTGIWPNANTNRGPCYPRIAEALGGPDRAEKLGALLRRDLEMN